MGTIFNKSLLNRIKHRAIHKRSLEIICKELKIDHNEVLEWLLRKDYLSPQKQPIVELLNFNKSQ